MKGEEKKKEGEEEEMARLTDNEHTCKKREIPEIYLRKYFGFSAKF